MKLISLRMLLLILLIGAIMTGCQKKPEACFSMNKAGTVLIGDQIQFNATCSANGNNYLWDYGDGTTGDGSQVSHRYDAPGTYTIQLTVCYRGSSSVKSQTLFVSK